MSVLIELFLTFFKIGAISFGGGYGMISVMRDYCLEYAWLSDEDFLSMIAVAESTPGPIAVNLATFIGSSQAGFWGSAVATLGVVLPSFIVIMVIAAVISNLLKYAPVKATLSGVRPAVPGMIFATVITMAGTVFFNFTDVYSPIDVDLRAIFIFIVLLGVAALWKKVKKKKPSPILMILFSAILGILCYGWLGNI